jgi:predicted AAA+ superfamily ATPase
MEPAGDVLKALNPWWWDARADLPPPPVSPYRRRPYSRIRERLFLPSTRGLLLFGQRQIGKTELCRQVFEELLRAARADSGFGPGQLAYLAVDDPRVAGVTIANLLKAWEPHRDPRKPALAIVDEAHHLGEGREDLGQRWERQLKGLVDLGNIRLLATGSSARVLQDGAADAPGRWTLQAMEPLSFREFRELRAGAAPDSASRFVDLQEYLVRGGFPAQVFAPTHAQAHAATRERARQVLDLEIPGSRNTDRLQRLYTILLEHSGEHVDVSKLGQALGHSRPTIEAWLAQLEQALLIQRVPRMASTTLQEVRGQSKVYATDPGLIAALARTADPYADDRVRARLQEAAVLRHLREALVSSAHERMSIHCLQRLVAKRIQAEGDFAVCSDREAVLIEVAGLTDLPSKRVRQERLALEIAGKGRFDEVRAFVVHAGAQRVPGRVPLVPLAEFLDELSLGFDAEPLAVLRGFAERIAP